MNKEQAAAQSDGGSQRVERLAGEVRRHRALYYNGQPELSDAAFDALEDELRRLAPQHPVLSEVGAPPPEDEADYVQAEADYGQAEGEDVDVDSASQLLAMVDAAYNGKPVDWRTYKAKYLAFTRSFPNHPSVGLLVPARGLEWPKRAHEIPMGSLNKVNTEEQLAAWTTRCDELAKQADLPPISTHLAVSEKLDGISLEVLYDAGKIEAAITRGDGTAGEQITANVLRMKGVPERIEVASRVSVRGEVILRKSDVAEYEKTKRQTDAKFEKVKSLRNTASGVARTKLFELLSATRLLTVLFYDVEGVEGLISEGDKIAFLKKQGFEVPYFSEGDLETVASIYRRYEETDRKQLDYEIDGLVVRAASIAAQDLLGELNNRPRAAVAFKFGNETALSTVRSIEWNTGDSGRITPVASVDPVLLAGAEVRQASLHNLGLVRELGIAVGDEVLVSRRNDVIPYVEEVISRAGGREEAPTHCSACETEVLIEGEYLLCPNIDCPARIRGRIKIWIKQLGLLDWGEKTIDRFVSEGLIEEPADLYRLSEEDITELNGFGDDTARKLLGPLRGKMAIPFPIFIAALGIPAVSKETGKLLSSAGLHSLRDVIEAGAEKLSAIDGLGAIKANKILSGLTERAEEVERLVSVGVEVTAPSDEGPLAGLSFCFSGSHSRPRKVLASIVESQGGTVASGVKKGLNYLVLADASSTSSKAEKARKLGTEILDEERFVELVTRLGGSLASELLAR